MRAKHGCVQNQNTSPHDQQLTRTPRHGQIMQTFVFQIFQVYERAPHESKKSQSTYGDVVDFSATFTFVKRGAMMQVL